MSKFATLRIVPGMAVNHNSTEYQVIDLINSTEVLLSGLNDELVTVKASTLSLVTDQKLSTLSDLHLISSELWNEALSNYKLIAPLISLGKDRKRSDVQKVADSANKNISTIYRWLETYEASGLVSSLFRKKRKDTGIKRLDERVEKIISDTIETFYLNAQLRTPAKTAYEIRKICIQNNLPAPDASTVRNRILELSEEYVLRRRRGSKAANERFSPLRGSFPGADFPLAVVQIDHTPVDVIVVDDENRKSIKRPYLTIATDVYSKMCVGFYLSLDNPGGLATGLCISRAILGKETYLHSLGLDHQNWPCWGVMSKIHTDNAKEFRGTLLGRAVGQYGIIAERRPKGRPQYGGDVERAFRTYMHEVHNELPGTTFSNIQQKQNYDSEGRAIMTLNALEKWLTLFILGVYHQKPHAGNNGIPPIVQWERGTHGFGNELGTGIPMRIPDENRLKLDFMPYFEASIQEYGIRSFSMNYWNDALRRYIHSRNPKAVTSKQKYVCRYDPRDLSKIWMFDPETDQYLEIPYRDISRPPVSLWEVKDAKRLMKEQSRASTNEELIFKTIDEMRQIVAHEAAKKKSARVKQQRRKQWESSTKISLNKEVKKPNPAVTVEVEIEEFLPFDGIRES
jgi:putative transposase